MLRYLHIRQGNNSDKPFVKDCVYNLIKMARDDPNPPEIPFFDKMWDKIVKNPQHTPLFIAEDNGKAVGMAICHQFDSLDLGNAMSIGDLVVHPEARAGGIGSALIKHIIDYAIENDFQAIELMTPPNKSENHEKRNRFYEKHGFSEIGPGRLMFLDPSMRSNI